MPGGDRTGPLGMGPMTGRALGKCTGYVNPGYMNYAPGRYFAGRGRRGCWGGGRGRASDGVTRHHMITMQQMKLIELPSWKSRQDIWKIA